MNDPNAAGDLVEIEHVDEVEVVVDDASDRDTVAYVTGTTIPRERPRWLGGVLGILGLLVAWQVAAMTIFSDPSLSIPSPTEIIDQFGHLTPTEWDNHLAALGNHRPTCPQHS